MNLASFAGIFALIFVLELPDKTMIATVVMSARARPVSVFLGASVAFVAQMAIAALIGGALDLLPHALREGIVAALFLGGAAYLLFVPEKHEESEGTVEGDAEVAARPWREALTAFTVIFIAEFGDLTQIQAANLVAKTHQPWFVFAASSSALVCIAALGSFAGQMLVRRIPLARIRLLGGLIFLGLGIYTVVSLLVS